MYFVEIRVVGAIAFGAIYLLESTMGATVVGEQKL